MRRAGVLAMLVAALVAVVAGLAAGLLLAVAGGRDDDGSPRDRPTAASDAAGGAVDHFLSSYVGDDGRVVRHDQGGDTVSEGQAYALMLTAATGDRERFDRVWTWTRDHLQRPDGLFAWRWQDGEVRDDSPASDADVDIAGALATAGTRFDEPGLVDEARRIAAAVLDHETVDAGGRLVLVAGPWARNDRVVNPSYLATCGGADLAAVTGDPRWDRLAADGLELVDALSAEGLPPDWAVLDDSGRLQPIAAADQRDGPGRYGLDAARIPARLPVCPGGREVAARLWQRLQALDGQGAALAYSLDGRPLADQEHAVGLVGAAGAAQAAGDPVAAGRLLARAGELERAHPTYYGAAWLALSEVVLGLGESSGSRTGRALPAARGRSVPVQSEPTTTAPPTTESPTTAPATTEPPATTPTTAPPTTAPPTATSAPTVPSATEGGTTPTAATSGTDGGPPTTTATTRPGTSPPATAGPSDGRDGTDASDDGDLSTPASPGAELRTDPEQAQSDPREPARRRTGAITLAGLAATAALGAVTGLRERALVLGRSRRLGNGDPRTPA